MGTVSITKINRNLKDALIQSLDLIGGLSSYVSQTDTVLLKPNLNGAEGTTDINLTEALIQLLLDCNIKEIFIGESTFGNHQITEGCFRKTGFTALAEKYQLRLVNFNKSEAVTVPVKKPLILHQLQIAKEFFEATKVINLPVMKVHYATGITLALKNMKGILVADEKKHFHEAGLDQAIVDLNNTIITHLNIVDAIVCMEKMGPRGGDPVRLDLILAGVNPWEMDVVGSRIMGYTLDEVRHLKYYLESNGISEAQINQIEVRGATIEEVHYPFRKVAMEKVIPQSLKIHNTNACSSCMNALILSCSFLEGKPKSELDVYLGSIIPEGAAPNKFNLAFGNCCKLDTNCGQKINGCPPYPFELNRVLKEKGFL
jgi:uncharacterized protein (DUF362 family)